MSRLVEKINLPIYGEMYVACVEDVSMEAMQALQEPLKKLYEYEQEEEKGFLAHLPCKLGDVTYYVSPKYIDGNKEFEIVKDSPVSSINIKEDGIYISSGTDMIYEKIGSQWALLTREDAERKLKELEEKNE